MTNKELGDFISSDSFNETSESLMKKTEEIMGAGVDIVSSVFTGFPAYTLLRPFIEGIKDWKSRVELKQLAYYLKEFENLSQSERSEFSLMIQGNEEDFTERLFYYITQLNDKKKATLCGKIGVAYARRKITSSMFLRLIEAIKSANSGDLSILGIILSRKTHFDELDLEKKKTAFMQDLFCRERISNLEEFRKTAYRNLGLIESKVNLESVNLPPVGFSLDQVKEAVRNIREIHYFTELCFYLNEFGLSQIQEKRT